MRSVNKALIEYICLNKKFASILMRLSQFNFSDHKIDNYLKKQAKFELCVRDTCKNTLYK